MSVLHQERRGSKESFGKAMLKTRWSDCEPATKVGICFNSEMWHGTNKCNASSLKFVKAKPWTAPCSGTRCWWWRTTRGCQRWCDWWRPLDRWLSQQRRRRQGRRAIGCSIGKRTRRCSPPPIDRGEWDGLRKERVNFLKGSFSVEVTQEYLTGWI